MPKRTKSANEKAQEVTQAKARAVRNAVFHSGDKLGQFHPQMTIPKGVKEIWVFLLRGQRRYKGWWTIPVNGEGKFSVPEVLKNTFEDAPGQLVVRAAKIKS